MKQLLLFFITLILLFVVTACSGADTPTSSEKATLPQSAPIVIEDEMPPYLTYREEKCSLDGGITVSNDSLISGSLLVIDDDIPFRYGTSYLGSVNQNQKHSLVNVFDLRSQQYKLPSRNVWIKEEVFLPWENLIADFYAASGKNTVMLVSGFDYQNEKSLSSPFVSGYSIAINIYEDGASYSLASGDKKLIINGKKMTYLDWFQDHCAKHGFIYTGLTGTHRNTLATFRYVGVPHAFIMQKYDFIDTREYVDFLRKSTTECKIQDTSGNNWTIFYCPADHAKKTTKIDIPKDAVYTLSGDNTYGFIVAFCQK